MKIYKKISSLNIRSANIGDFFSGYGVLGNGAILVDKSIEQNIVWANFREVKKNGKPSVYSFTYYNGSISGSHKI